MPPAKTGTTWGLGIKRRDPLGCPPAQRLDDVRRSIEQVTKRLGDNEALKRDLEQRRKALLREMEWAMGFLRRKPSDSEQAELDDIARQLEELEWAAEDDRRELEALQREQAALIEELRRLANLFRKSVRTAEGLKAVKDCEAYFRAGYGAGDEKTREAVADLFDQYRKVAENPREELGTHEYRMLVRAEEGLGLKERGQGICFKMLDQYAAMSPREKAQIASIPNVISCTAEAVRAWLARNAEFAAEKAREAFEQSQEVEKARQEMQDLRLTCYPMPDWVRERIEEYPQKAAALHLGMRASLPVPFTRDEVIQSVRDVVGYSPGRMGQAAGQCAAVDPTSVHIAKHVAGVLARWFSSFGWVKVQLADGGRWRDVHLADAVDKLHNDPFTQGFSPNKESYATPLELGPSFTTTFDAQQRLAAAPAWMRIFGRPVFGPAAALAEELAAKGELTPEDRARIEELMRSGVTWEQLQQRAGANPSGETMTHERPVTPVRPRL